VIVIDPWNEVEHLWGKQDTEATYLNRALKHLKRLARRFQIVIIVVTHPTAAGGRVESIEAASLYDINGGAVWNNKADIGLIVRADDTTLPERHIKVAKSKDYQRMGRPGIVRMSFVPERASFDFIGTGK
jgi:twinkle protein